jgi:transposase
VELYNGGERDPLVLGMSESTVYRWKQRPAGDALENAQNAPHGRPREVSALEVGVAHVVKAAHPTATSAEVSHVISTVTGGQAPPPYAITRMLKDYNAHLTLNHMKIESHATEGCPVQRDVAAPLPTAARTLWSTNGVWHRLRRRVLLLPRPQKPHRWPRATRFDSNRPPVARHGHEERDRSWCRTIWLRIQDENLDQAGWTDFLSKDVIPTCGPNRTFLFDNLKAHVTVRSTQLVIQAGHTPLARPTYSPWLAPIEFIFGLMEAHLRRISHLVTRENFRCCIIHAYRAATTPANCAAIFRHCGL